MPIYLRSSHRLILPATATYRLHPLIQLSPSKPVPPHLAQKFASCFSPGVVKVSPDNKVSIDERHLRKETMSREVLRHKEFEDCVKLARGYIYGGGGRASRASKR